ncbi:sialate O-acetylesterase [Bacteroidota bacterium]
MKLTHRILPVLFLVLLFSLNSNAQLQLPLNFQSGMVLQRELDIPFWGASESNAKVIVVLNDISDSTTADVNGKWNLSLPQMNAGGPYELVIISEEEKISITDVYIGDVWLASGQSNMAWILADSDPPDDEIDPADNHAIRQFLVPRTLRTTTSEDLPTGSRWMPADNANSGQFTAVGYYFAKYLYAHLEIPIGIINSSYGGTSIESWTSSSVLGYDEQDIVLGDGSSYLQPTLAYNAMLYPLRKIPLKGIIWYQGESNTGSRESAVLYRSQFKKLINSWRELWGIEDLPFLWVQLPNTGAPANEDAPGTWDGWPLLRESQSATLDLPYTEETITIDIGDEDIHPTNKQPVGKRLSLLARSIVYGDTIVYSGPRYKKHTVIDNGRIRIEFDHPGQGLISIDSEPLRWFSLVRENGAIVKANAIIEDNMVVLWNDNVSNPTAIRYAWETNPENINFFNADSLPAAPFYVYTDTLTRAINTFATSDAHIDRGESTMLRWDVSGNGSVFLNAMEVDPKSAIRIWPVEDSIFTLKVKDPQDASSSISKVITVYVRQPIPTIEINADSARLIPLDSSLIINAMVSAQAGAPIEKVEFYVNGELAFTDPEEPFEFTWTATETGSMAISGKVFNELGTIGESNTLSYTIKEFEFKKYEAEHALFTNGVRITPDEEASGGYFMDLMTDWTLTFDSIISYTGGEHLLYIRFMLNYGSPKLQSLIINGDEKLDLLFSAPDRQSWYDFRDVIRLDSGLNKIQLESIWDYMSIDYILLGSEPYEVPVDTSSTDTTGTNIKHAFSRNSFNMRSFPNPLRSFGVVEVNLPERGELLIELFDLNGRKVQTIYKGSADPGRHKYNIALESNSDLLFIRCMYKESVLVEKLIRLE